MNNMTPAGLKERFPVWVKCITYSILFVFTVFTLFPLIWLSYSSVKPPQDIITGLISLPKTVTFVNYIRAWDIVSFGQLFINSIFYAFVTVTVTIVLAVCAAFAFCKIPSKLTPFFYGFFLLGLLLTISSAIVPIFVLENTLGLLDTRIGILIPYIAFNLPFAIFLASSYIRSVPDELMMAAKVDGASYLQMCFYLIFPISRPIIGTIAIFTFLGCWQEFILVYIITSSDRLRTVPVGVVNMGGEMTFNYGLQFAAIVIATLPILIFYVIFRKQLLEGFVAGAVKE